jgi:hypothetical protein
LAALGRVGDHELSSNLVQNIQGNGSVKVKVEPTFLSASRDINRESVNVYPSPDEVVGRQFLTFRNKTIQNSPKPLGVRDRAANLAYLTQRGFSLDPSIFVPELKANRDSAHLAVALIVNVAVVVEGLGGVTEEFKLRAAQDVINNLFGIRDVVVVFSRGGLGAKSKGNLAS